MSTIGIVAQVIVACSIPVGTFCTKIGMAFSTFSCSWILSLSGYDATQTVQVQGILNAIRFCFALIPVVCVCIALFANFRLQELETLKNS